MQLTHMHHMHNSSHWGRLVLQLCVGRINSIATDHSEDRGQVWGSVEHSEDPRTTLRIEDKSEDWGQVWRSVDHSEQHSDPLEVNIQEPNQQSAHINWFGWKGAFVSLEYFQPTTLCRPPHQPANISQRFLCNSLMLMPSLPQPTHSSASLKTKQIT